MSQSDDLSSQREEFEEKIDSPNESANNTSPPNHGILPLSLRLKALASNSRIICTPQTSILPNSSPVKQIGGSISNLQLSADSNDSGTFLPMLGANSNNTKPLNIMDTVVSR